MSRPKDAQYEWLPAKSGSNRFINYAQRRYYKFKDGEWYSWSAMFEQWVKTKNDAIWFTEQIIQGYFVEVNNVAQRPNC